MLLLLMMILMLMLMLDICGGEAGVHSYDTHNLVRLGGSTIKHLAQTPAYPRHIDHHVEAIIKSGLAGGGGGPPGRGAHTPLGGTVRRAEAQ